MANRLVTSNATVYNNDTVTTITPTVGTSRRSANLTLTAMFMLGSVTLFVFPIVNRTLRLDRRTFNA